MKGTGGLNSKGERGRFREWLQRDILTGRHTLFSGASKGGKLLGDQRAEKTCNHDRPRCKPSTPIRDHYCRPPTGFD